MANRHTELIELLDEYAALREALENGSDSDEELDATFAAFQVSASGVAAAMDQLVRIDRLLDGEIAEVKAVLDGLRLKQGQVVGRKAALRRYLLVLLQRADLQNVKTPLGTVHQTRSHSVEILDLAAIPDAFVKVELTAQKKEIGAALKAGHEVPGARLVETLSAGVR